MKLALIDICDTLYSSNTTFDFIKWMSGKPGGGGIFGFLKKIPVKAVNKILFLLFRIDIPRWIVIRRLNGLSKDELLLLANRFYEEFLVPRKKKEVHLILQDLKEQNYDLILVSATLDFIAETIAGKLYIDKFFSTQLYYDNNICKGKIKSDLLGRKERLIIPIIHQYNEVITVTDNKSDLPLIKLSSRSIVVSDKKNVSFWKKKLNGNFNILLNKDV